MIMNMIYLYHQIKHVRYKKMNRVVSILMNRDGITEAEAKEMVQDTRDAIQEAIAFGDYDLVDDIIAGDLGLEPDYVMDIIW